MHAFRAGQHLGHYELVRPLGSGAMGAVYEARHRTLGRRVAIKVLHRSDRSPTDAEVAAARFLREGRAAAQVRHPHVVDVFDFGVADGMPFLVMELVEGETLATRLSREGPLPLADAADVMLPVLAAVAELHAAGIVHRDLKPANILLARDRTGSTCPKVADFGVSRLDDGSPSVTASNAVLGTYAYMAPEQQRSSKQATEQADQYALGVMLCECATGTRPLFTREGSEPPPPMKLLGPQGALPDGFAVLVRRAMSREPADRFACVDDLAAALLPFAASRIRERWTSEFRGPRSERDAPPSSERPPSLRAFAARAGSDAAPLEGHVLASRYRLVRFLARGGMGEVYEAEDLSLGSRIALKAIAPVVAADPTMSARLKREVLLARKVTHPSVCRLHDLGEHTDAHGTILFLTMDLLRGETLAAHLEREGQLTTDDAAPLVRQMADALEAAHKAGVLHRDLKPRNVMLVPGQGGHLRAVVTDFGIATDLGDTTAPVDADGARSPGTPAYMAPEQIEGGPLSPASDVYALGLVMFEMVTGSLPFESPSAAELIARRLAEPAPEPRSRVPSLDARWNRTISRCLERDPRKRFASAHEVTGALEAPARRWRTRHAVIAGTLVAALAGAAGLAAARQSLAKHAPVVVAEGRRSAIGVLALASSGHAVDPGVAWIPAALTDMLGNELAAGRALRVASSDRVARALREMSIDDPSQLSPQGLSNVGVNLGTDYVVTGTVSVDGTSVRVEAKLQDARTGAAIASLHDAGTSQRLQDLAGSMAASIRRKLGVHDLDASQEKNARAATPGNPEAMRAYSEGQAAMRRSDLMAARDAFARAAAADPDYPLAHEGLARALGALGDDARALDEAKRALETSHDLSREAQLVVEARYRAAGKDWRRAAESYHTLYGFFPDTVEYGRMYATALDNAGDADKALAVIEELHRLPPPDGDDPEVEVLESIAADHVSDQKHAQSAARAAIASARAREQPLTEADGHLELAESLWGVYDYESAQPEFQLARATYERLGEKRKLSAALAGLSGLQTDQGEPLQALPTITQAIDVARAIGDHFQIGVRLRQLGDTHASLGDVTLARQAWEGMRDEFATMGVERQSARAVGRLGRAFAMEGDAARARASLVEARERERAVHALDHALEETISLAALALETGDLAEAEHQANDALAAARQADDRLSAAQAQLCLAWIARERGDAAASAKTLSEATEGFTATHDGEGRIDVKLLLATLALDGGRSVDGEAAARDAIDAAHAGGYRPREASARAMLARALLAEGRTPEAASEMDRAEALPLEDVATPIDVVLARTAVLAAQGDTTRAQELLDGALARAQSAVLLPRALEAKLARARLRPGAPRVLAALAAEAVARGLVRLAKTAGR